MKIRKFICAAVLIALAAAIAARPEKYVAACLDGIILWAESVLPSLFVFSVICSLLIATGAANALEKPFSPVAEKLNLPAVSLTLFLTGICCGYPTGSRFLYEYRKSGAINDKDCKRLAPLLSSASPLFMLGTVGVKAFGDSQKGVILAAVCIFSVIAPSAIYCILTKGKREKSGLSPLQAKPTELYDIFFGAVTAVCVAGGFIAFFHTVAEIFSDLGALTLLSFPLSFIFGKESAKDFCGGLIEATGGILSLASSDGFFALPLSGFLTVFGGISIIFQQLSYLQKCKVNSSFFIIFKIIQGALCFCILCIVQSVCG